MSELTKLYKCLRNNVRTLNGDGMVDIETIDGRTQVTIELQNDKYTFTELNDSDDIMFSYGVRPNVYMNDYITVYKNILLHDVCCDMFYDDQFCMVFTFDGVRYRLFYRFFDIHNLENCGLLIQLVDDVDGMVYDFDDGWVRDVKPIYTHVVLENDDNAKFISSLCENDV